MTTRNGRAATPCEVSEPAGTEAPPAPRLQGSSPTPARGRSGGEERAQPKGKRLAGRSSLLRARRWATNGLGVESCGEAFVASWEFWGALFGERSYASCFLSVLELH